MKLGFFTMPIHTLDKDWRQSLREDREAFILADELGFAEGYVGEHATDRAENITSAAMFLATLVDATKRMKLGTGTVNLPNTHPAAVASQIAMLDHLLDGRFIFGIGPGGLLSDAEVFGNLDADRNAMFVEAIDQILALWRSDPPYRIAGRFWSPTIERQLMLELGQGYVPKPLQRPHPPIVATAASPYPKGLVEAAARGWDPISANFLMPVWVRTHWDKYVEGCTRAGRPASPANWRVARSIFVADDDATARDYVTDAGSPYRFYYHNLYSKLRRWNRLMTFKTHAEQPDEEVTLEGVCDALVIHGSPARVVDQLLALRERIGDFGTLLYVGKDWRDRALSRRSMILMAEQVMPALNAAIGRSIAAAE